MDVLSAQGKIEKHMVQDFNQILALSKSSIANDILNIINIIYNVQI